MTMARWQSTIVDDEGNVQDGATVTVRREVAGAPLASLFSDRDGLVPTGNPITADSEGFAAFHAAGDAYRITATKGAFSRVWRYVGIGLLSEQDSVEVAGDVTGPAGGVVDNEFAYSTARRGRPSKVALCYWLTLRQCEPVQLTECCRRGNFPAQVPW